MFKYNLDARNAVNAASWITIINDLKRRGIPEYLLEQEDQNSEQRKSNNDCSPSEISPRPNTAKHFVY